MSDTQARIDDLVKQNEVLLFMKGSASFPMCGFSGRAIQILKACGVDPKAVKTVNVLDDAEIRNGIKEYSNWPTIPQLYVKGEFLGGSDIMMEMYSSGELDAMLDELGGPKTYNHYPNGWAMAFNTPFKMWKRYEFNGGTSDPCVISWPAGMTAKGEIREQYHHAIDLVPTVLDALGIDRAVIAGHSGSGLVARRVAIDHPERVAGLVLEASPTALVANVDLHAFVATVPTGGSEKSTPIDRVEVETEALLLEILSDYQVSIPELGTIEAKQIPLVFLTSNNTRELSEALKRRCREIGSESLLESWQTENTRACTGNHHADITPRLHHHDAHHGVPRGGAWELHVGGAMHDGKAYAQDEFTWLEGRREQAREEGGGRNFATIRDDGGIEAHHRRRIVGGRVIVGDGAANGAAVAHQRVADATGQIG